MNWMSKLTCCHLLGVLKVFNALYVWDSLLSRGGATLHASMATVHPRT